MKLLVAVLLSLLGILCLRAEGCQVRIVLDGREGSTGFVQVFIAQWQYLVLADVSESMMNGMCNNLGFDGLNNMMMMPPPVNANLTVAQCNTSDVINPTSDAVAGCSTEEANKTTEILYVDCMKPDATNGTLRLSNGNGTGNGMEGMLQVSTGDRWSVVSVPSLSRFEANTVCRGLGFGRARSVTTNTVITLFPIVVIDVTCGNTSIIDCIGNGTTDAIQNGNRSLTCLVDTVSTVSIQCSPRRGLNPIFPANLSRFGAVLLGLMTLLIAAGIIITLFYITFVIMVCKRRKERNAGGNNGKRRPSFWSRARASIRSRASSYSFVWTRQEEETEGARPSDNSSTTGMLNGSYLKWTDEAQSRSSTMKSTTSQDVTTFGLPLEPQPV